MTEYRVHREADLLAFVRRVLPYLMQREAEHNIILGLFAVLQARPPAVPPYLAWIEAAGQVAGVAMRTPPFRLLLAHGMTPAAIAAIAEDVRRDTPTLPGALGSQGDIAAFTKSWQALTGQTVDSVRAERLYRLTAVRPAPPTPGMMRALRDDELELAADWWQAFSAEAIEPIERDRAIQAIQNRFGVDPLVGGIRLWDVDGVPVSLAGYTGPTPNSIRVGPVYTPPVRRGRGYATALVAALSRELLDLGFGFVTLYTDLANPTSNRIYQAIGYQPVTDIAEVHFAGA